MDVIELWWLSLAISAVVIVVVAVLLGLIIAAAKSIDHHAAQIWVAGKQIAGNTVSIWMLHKTIDHLEDLTEATHEAERTTRAMNEKLAALGGPGAAGG
jgi:hypothetical protein